MTCRRCYRKDRKEKVKGKQKKGTKKSERKSSGSKGYIQYIGGRGEKIGKQYKEEEEERGGTQWEGIHRKTRGRDKPGPVERERHTATDQPIYLSIYIYPGFTYRPIPFILASLFHPFP